MREKRFNLAHRLIHWAIALTILFMLLTIFLRLGWMDKNRLGNTIQESLNKSDIHISADQAISAGKAVRGTMWQYHILAGYVLIGLYIVRIIITSLQGLAYPNPLSKNTSSKEKFKSWLYIVFYLLLAVSLVTGFMVVNGPKDLKENMEFIHVKSLYYVLAFIILHIGGVMLADAGAEKGIISKMISGDKHKL